MPVEQQVSVVEDNTLDQMVNLHSPDLFHVTHKQNTNKGLSLSGMIQLEHTPFIQTAQDGIA